MILKYAVLSLIIISFASSQFFTPSSFSVSPNYAKSTNSQYIFSFNAITPFNTNFDIRVYFPSQYSIASVSGCSFALNNQVVSSAQCSFSSSTNQIIFTQLNIATAISSIRITFNTTTPRFSGSSTIIFYYYNTTTNTIISSLTNYISLNIVNAIMPCTVTSTSVIVGDNVTYTFSYSPLVQVEANSILQIQMQPWGSYSQSNFITTNTTLICNNNCTLSVPATNGNLSQLIRYTAMFPSSTQSNGSLVLSRARNPASTSSISITLVMLAKISSSS